jgi:alkanesulfonate monooxygenase SsuD/methylene tetrahydromethanopterin reductase-like flavin-dependent oxidoreductase (luciferase family)
MKTGINFFPSCRPDHTSASAFYEHALDLSELADRLGYVSVKIVEHHGSPYGGYSPSPLIFLSAVAQRTERVRLVTGAVVPAFAHPVKLAAELAMVDCISDGRLDAGFARGFLPHEFATFGISMEESRERFEDGIEAVRRLWTEDVVDFDGRFHKFEGVTLLPRPCQRPHPPIKVAAVSTPESFEWAGDCGYGLMVVPYLSNYEDLAGRLGLYREHYVAATGAKPPPVSVVMHLFLASSDAAAREESRPFMRQYIDVAKEGTAAWAGRSSSQYRGYDKVHRALSALTIERAIDENRALIGSPETVSAAIGELEGVFGDIQLEVNVMFGDMDVDKARRSVELYADEVLVERERRSEVAA